MQLYPGLSWWSSYWCTAQNSLWPSKYLMTCMHRAINDLSHYITVQSYCLQNMGREGVRVWNEKAWKCHLVNCHTIWCLSFSVWLTSLSMAIWVHPYCCKWHYFIFFNLFLKWGKTALQCCVGFWHTTMQISHNHTYVPYLLNPTSHLPPHHTPLGH